MKIICKTCGRKSISDVSVWPYRCFCGMIQKGENCKQVAPQKRNKQKAGGGKAKRKPPPFATRIISYAAEVRRWERAGKPNRDDATVEQILSTHCQPCEHYNAKKKKCMVCGCQCNKSRNPLVNKIRMATTSCPLDDPKWTAAVEPPVD